MTEHPAEVVKDANVTDGWRVEKIMSDGAVEVTIFAGSDARARADKYATWRYGAVVECETAPSEE